MSSLLNNNKGACYLAHYSFTIVQVLSAVLYRFIVCTGIVA